MQIADLHDPRRVIGEGGGIRVAIWVPYEHGEARIATALAAGGRMVRDDLALSWWTSAGY